MLKQIDQSLKLKINSQPWEPSLKNKTSENIKENVGKFDLMNEKENKEGQEDLEGIEEIFNQTIDNH